MLSYSLMENAAQISAALIQRKRKYIVFVPHKTECVTRFFLPHANQVVAAFLCILTGTEKNGWHMQ